MAQHAPTSVPQHAPARSTAAGPPDWLRAFQDVTREHAFEQVSVEGRLPSGLSGTLYWNGSGFFDFITRPEHRAWTDGQGAVGAVRFSGDAGPVCFALRRVRTRSAERELSAGRRLYSRFALPAPRPLREFLLGDRRTAGNVSVWAYRGRLFALDPLSTPTELDPNNLDSLGETDLDGCAPPGFSAHASFCAARRCFYNFAAVSGRRSSLELFEFPLDARPRHLTSIPLAAACFVHDFLVTDRYAIFVVPPLALNPLPMLMGLKSASECFGWRPELGTECIVVDLNDPERPLRYTLDPALTIHFANAFERDGELVVHVPVSEHWEQTWRWLTGIASGQPGTGPTPRMHELRVDLRRRRASLARISDTIFEQPRVSPRAEGREYRYVWGAGFSAARNRLPDALCRLDLSSGETVTSSVAGYAHLSEPVFVPRVGSRSEDDGYLLSVAYAPSTHCSSVLIFDARAPGNPPLCQLPLGQHVPPLFHATWVGRGDEVAGLSPGALRPAAR